MYTGNTIHKYTNILDMYTGYTIHKYTNIYWIGTLYTGSPIHKYSKKFYVCAGTMVQKKFNKLYMYT